MGAQIFPNVWGIYRLFSGEALAPSIKSGNSWLECWKRDPSSLPEEKLAKLLGKAFRKSSLQVLDT